MGRITASLKHAWSMFTSDGRPNPDLSQARGTGISFGGYRPQSTSFGISRDRSVLNSIYTRMAVDVSTAEIRHVRTNENGQYLNDMDSGLNNCLSVEANIDQGPQALLRDYAHTLFDTGVVAVVPTRTSDSPISSGGYDIKELRVATIRDWKARSVMVRVYNDHEDYGTYEDVWVDKSTVAIIENPFYAIMNEPNSTLKRLQRKLDLLDKVDEANASGKLDLLIQLPYQIKTEARRKQAKDRIEDIQVQLRDSSHGIAYIDSTDKITQLNRPVENTLREQIKDLITLAHDQLGITADILNGTAPESVMLNYNARIIEPLLDILSEEIYRKFLTKTARTQRQQIKYYKNPFKFIPLSQLAEVTDVMSRNEILAPNEIRGFLGMKPSSDPAADKLNNSNMPDDEIPSDTPVETLDEEVVGGGEMTMAESVLDELETSVGGLLSEMNVSPPSPNDSTDEEVADADSVLSDLESEIDLILSDLDDGVSEDEEDSDE